MKLWFTILAFMISGFLIPGVAQSGDRFGGDKEACGRNYTIYYELYKLKNYKEAIPYWQKTVEICPRFSLTLWKNGEKMYLYKIKNSDNEDEIDVLVDSLLWIYDQRMLYFGDDKRSGTGYVIGRKGLVILHHRKSEADKAYNLLSESIKIDGTKSKADIILTYMQVSRFLYAEGVLNSENVLNDFETCMNIIEENLLLDPGSTNFNKAKNGVEQHFTKSGAADCDALINLYSKQFETKKDDNGWLSKIARQLKRTGCADGDFYMDISLAQFELNPNGEDAHNLAKKFLQSEDFTDALSFLMISLDLGVEDNEKAHVYYELAYVQFSQLKDFKKARDYARKAIEIRPNWGDLYLLIGKIYIDARTTAFTEDFDQATVFWAAIDQFAMAKKVDPEVSDKAKELIRTYSAHFPKTETLFYYALKKGDKYQIKGWINEKTTVRGID